MPQKKKLLVLLGAGSSLLRDADGVSQGMPSTTCLNKMMQDWAADLVTGTPKIYTGDRLYCKRTAGKPNYYEMALRNREAYYANALTALDDIARPNYERILGDLHGYMNGFLPKPFGDPILHWLQESVPKGRIDFSNNNAFDDVLRQIKALFEKLVQYMRQRSLGFESGAATSPTFDAYAAFLRELKEHYALGIYTLNYDTLALTALPGAFTGFDHSDDLGHFLPPEVHERPNWDFIYHLHGSVHHSFVPKERRVATERSRSPIRWQQNLTGYFCDDGGELRIGTDHRRMVPSLLIAGGWKLDQIQEDPFQTFYSALPRHAYEADAVLIGGYGFGDDHINSVLRGMLWARSERGHAPPVLVLDKAPTENNRWPRCQTLMRRNAFRFSDSESIDLPLRFSNDPTMPMAVSSGGFEQAGAQVEEILRWLEKNSRPLRGGHPK